MLTILYKLPRASVVAGLLVVLGGLIFGTASCSPAGNAGHDSKLGVILPLTGGAAALGKPSFNGMQLAVGQYNRARATGEPLITLTVEDDGAEPAKSVSAFQKLITADNIRLILGPLTSGTTLAVAPLAQRDRVVVLSPGASASLVTRAGDYVFRDELSEAFGARAQADLAFSRLGYRKVALLYVNNEYGVGTAGIFRQRFTKLGGQIVAEEKFLPGTSDFRTALEKIRGSKADAVFVIFQDSIVNIVRQAAPLAIRIFTTPIFEDSANLQMLGSLAEGIVYTYYGTFDLAEPSAQTFVQVYRTRFQEYPTYYAALGYDAARMMIDSLRRCKFDQEKLRDCLATLRDFKGVTGTMSFDQNGDVIKPVSLKIVRRGQFVPY